MSPFPLPEATDYQSYLKPRVATLLRSVGLDKEYVRAQGDYLLYRTDEGVEHRVLDLVGGFGSTILGHNHPELVDLLSRALMDRTPVMAQGSIRTQAGYLAKTLCNLMEERTGTEWIVTLTNSGAEAIEAAVKHAMYRKSIQIDDILEQQQNTLLEILTRPDWKEHIPDAVLRLYLKCTRSELDERFSQQKLLQSYADALQQILSKDLHLVD
ncbi:hypothetical protein AB833_29110 [Chromatiales bacterium (ex Bugula neritina AB1)]|nr:hypothetical protein AB833_29110 [Chromatiales bacterium (ex Bugula neritina AB1)]